MNEVRIDPLSGHKTIVASERADRPGGGPAAPGPPQPIDPERDPFAEGHEDRTPPELYAVRPNGGGPNATGWTVRVVPNLYPALEADGDRPPPPPDDLFQSTAATGAHEVIINAPQSVSSLSELEAEQVAAALDAWRARLRAHAASACRQLIVNERHEAGASLAHTHAQLYALDFVPADVARERERFGAYATRTLGQNLLADLIAEEVRRDERIVAIDDEAVLLAPYASRMPFQLMLAPRRARERFEDDGPTGALLLHDGLRRLARLFDGHSPPLNMWVRTAPRGADHFCWRIDIVPRLTHLAGLELSTGVNLNVVAPERAAQRLRDVS